MLIWMLISLSHIYYRPILLNRKQGDLEFKMPGYPYTSWIAVILLAGIIVALWFIPEQRIGIYSGVGWLSLISLYYFIAGRSRVKFKQPDELRHIELASFFGGFPVKEYKRKKK